jgi:hypothetical protein
VKAQWQCFLFKTVIFLEFVKRILAACINIHTLTLKSRIDFDVDIDRLKNLKELHVRGGHSEDLKVVTFLTIPMIETLLTSS